MWQSTSSNQTIPPNLLKNFNPYDILEPQKNGANNGDATNVDKLIDIDDSSQDSGFHDLDSSLLNKNKEFDLIDVYENILVTPQHIKVKSKKDEVVSSAPNVDFKEFFDVIESGKKIDWTKPSTSKEGTASKRYDYEEIIKPKVLDPPVLNEPDLDPDDYIYEVLARKNIIKPIFNETKSSNVAYSTNKASSMTSEGTRPTLNNQENDENKPSFTTETSINKINNNFTVIAMKKDEKVYKKKRLVKPVSQTSKFTKGPGLYEKSVVLPQIMARMCARKEYLEEKNNMQRRLLLDSGTKILQTENNVSNTEKKVNNEKKNTEVGMNAIKTENEKKVAAVGVSAIKSFRISESKKLTDAIITSANRSTKSAKTAENGINSVYKTASNTDYGKLSPTVLMADCNKERLEAWQKSQLFKNFVLKGKFEL